jgi:tetratricopeptide (TPR) repeat protein
MSTGTQFECCECHEPFTYDPAPRVIQRIEGFQRQTARRSAVVVECPHCPAALYLDLTDGSVCTFTQVHYDLADTGGVFRDMTPTESIKAKVLELNKEGERLMAAGQSQDARGQFQEAIRLRKHDPQSWYHLGISYMQDQDPSGAKEAFRHALRYDSSLVQAWNSLGAILLSERQVTEASDAFDNGIHADPECAECYCGKGNVCLLRGDAIEAKRLFEIALDKDPNYDKARQAIRHLSRLPDQPERARR